VGATGFGTSVAAIILFWEPGLLSALSRQFFSREFRARKWATRYEGADTQSGAAAVGSRAG
jgi:hypothetical protein